MQSITFSDPEWCATFPCRVTPQHDEWLAGLLLRCDEVNHWGSGTTFAYLRRASGTIHPMLIPYLIVPPQLQVEYIAQWLALSAPTLRATTYLPELTRCYGVLHPLPGDLRPSFSFRICPECLAENRLLKRTLALLHILYCPWHEVTLLRACQCGTSLRLFNQHTSPFTCHACRRDWADLPRMYPTPERIAVTRQLLSCYERFLSWGDPTLVKKALHAVVHAWEREIIRSRKLSAVRRPYRKSSSPHLASNHVASLGPLVFNLVKYHLYYDPKVIFWGQDDWGQEEGWTQEDD